MARVPNGAERKLTARFEALADHYVFEPCFARPRTGHDKGDDREFRCRAPFQGGAFEVTLEFAPDGKVARFDLARREQSP